MLRNILFVLALLVVVAVAFLSWRLLQDELVITIDEAQLQQRLDQRFPIEHTYAVALTLTLRDPRLTLEEGSDRLRFATDAIISLPVGGSYSGQAEISGAIAYDAQNHAFLLTDARIETLRVAGAPEQAVERARQASSLIARELLDRVPIYKLDDDGLAQRSARLLLKDVEVSNGSLRVVLGRSAGKNDELASQAAAGAGPILTAR